MKEYVICKICGEKKSHLGTHLKYKHGMNKEKYIEMYPNEKLCSEVYAAKISKANKGRHFGTYEEQFGKKKADELKESHRKRMKERICDGTIPRKMTKPHKMVYDLLNGVFGEEIKSEYFIKYYSVDIAYPKNKIAVEIHGNYFHNKDGKPFEELSEMQKKNITNDKKKKKFLERKGWHIIVCWESDILKNIQSEVDKITSFIGKENIKVPYDYGELVKHCKYCGKKIEWIGGRLNKTYCNRDCFYLFKRANKEKNKLTCKNKDFYSSANKTCCICGKSFNTKECNFSNKRKTCSAKCHKTLSSKAMKESEYVKERKKNAYITLICECGKEFTKHVCHLTMTGRRYCSQECYHKYHPRFNKKKEN